MGERGQGVKEDRCPCAPSWLWGCQGGGVGTFWAMVARGPALPPLTPALAPPLQWERLWFLLLTFTFGLTLTWLYFWWEVHNDYDEFNW